MNLFQAAGWPGVLEMFLRLLIACICGCAIGTEFDFEHLKKLVLEKTGGVIEDVSAVHGRGESVTVP